MKTILCPTDFSIYAEKALEYAVAIASKMEAKLILMNAFEVEDHPRGVIKVAQPGLGAGSLDKLEDWKEKVKQFPGGESLELETYARQGNVVTAILDIIREHDADLVIMGTKGAAGLKEVILGSKTAALIKKTIVPVLAVPDEAEFNPIDKLAFATEFDDGDDIAIDSMVDFARKFDAELQVVHVISPEGDFNQKAIDDMNASLVEGFDYDKISFHIVRNDNVLEGLQDFLEENQTDVVAMISQQRTFMEGLFHRSLTRKMAMETTTPLIAFEE